MTSREKLLKEVEAAEADLIYYRAKVKELSEKGFSLLSKEYFKKAAMRDALSKINSAEKKIEKLKCDTNGIRAVIKKFDIPVSKSSTTMVRGYHDYTHGYKLYDNYILLRGNQYCQLYQKLIEALQQDGYEIERTEKPEATIGIGTTAKITVKKVIE